MKDFNEYVIVWFQDFVSNHESDSEWVESLAEQLGYEQDDEETPLEYLQTMDEADFIYKSLFGYESHVLVDDLTTTEDFAREMLGEIVKDLKLSKYDFVGALLEDMAEHIEGYDTPLGFFADLNHGGCASGLIGMFIYNQDCKEFYIQHMDSMEDFKQDWENMNAYYVKNTHGLPYYTFLCWFCYEELGYEIGRALFPEVF
jgi:hypothetical protein